ncbi:MAG: hypothetical protein ACTHZ5_00380 [Micrococcaceae bacterium]
MVQLHAIIAGLPVIRPTTDVDMILHVETGAISGSEITNALSSLGYTLQLPLPEKAVAHRFLRTTDGPQEVVDVMIADHARPKPHFYLGRRKPFAVPAGTQALQRAFTCTIKNVAGHSVAELSLPSPLAALILKGAAFREDSRTRGRHLEDAAELSATLDDPLSIVSTLKGSDRSRIIGLNTRLSDPLHPAWSQLDEADQRAGRYALDILSRNPQEFNLNDDLGPAI